MINTLRAAKIALLIYIYPKNTGTKTKRDVSIGLYHLFFFFEYKI